MASGALDTWTDLSEALALHTSLTVREAISLTSAIEVGTYGMDQDRECPTPPGVLFGPLTILLDPAVGPDRKGHAVRALLDLARLYALDLDGHG